MKTAAAFFLALFIALWFALFSMHASAAPSAAESSIGAGTLGAAKGIAAAKKSAVLTHKATDLGYAGNAEVDRVYEQYLAQEYGCAAVNNGPRVIVTGFGLFEGVNFNISGAVVANMANPSIWPSQINLSEALPQRSVEQLSRGTVAWQDYGGRVSNRALTIDGRNYSVCFITLDVIWDLAGSIIVTEMARFEPHLVLMTGRGANEVILEGGALNGTTSLTGFYSNGERDHRNVPMSDRIVVTGPAAFDREVKLSWDNQRLKSLIEPQVKELGYPLQAPLNARSNNDYICNNVSYIASQAATGHRLNLAGGHVIFPALRMPGTQVGFMHLPDSTPFDPRNLLGFAKIIATLIDGAL